MRRFFLLLVLLQTLCLPAVHAQGEVRGYVEDSTSHERLANVSVTLLRGGKAVKFTRSKADGSFSFPLGQQEGDFLQASLMGYKKKKVAAGKNTVISLASSAFQLKEVQVQGARISGRDTITFDLTRFATDRDNSLKDVLKKLPGVDVAKDGKISYNGQDINRFTVEGLDLTGGRYNTLEENIKAKDVKKAEIIEHDQPIKALQNKTYTDDIAMNIALKDSARDRLMPTIKPYLLTNNPTHVGGSLNVLQVGKKRQLMYQAEYDRTGENFDRRFNVLTFSTTRLSAADVPSWRSVPSLSSPIDEERLRFNTSQHYSINHITKNKSGSENRTEVDYTRTVTRQETANTSIYDLGEEQPITTTEHQNKTILNDHFNMEWEHKINQDTHYGNERIKVEASQGDGLSSINDTLTQRIRVPKLDLEAALYRVYVKKKGQLTWRSTADYHHSVSDLYVNFDRDRLRTNLWHTAHSLGWMRKKGHLTRSQTLKAEMENLNVMGENHADITFSFNPSWTYSTETLHANFSTTYEWERLTHQNKNFFSASPILYINKQIGNRQELTGHITYQHNIGNKNTFTLSNYRKNYRNWYAASDIVPESRLLNANVSYNYKRPIKELFLRAALSGGRYWNNTATDLRIIDGQYYSSLYEQDSKSDNLNAQLFASKGFYKLHLKTALKGTFGYAKGTQYSAGKALDYTVHNYTLSPNITFSPSWCQVDYDADFSWYESERKEQAASNLFNWKQTFSLTSTIKQVDLTFSLVHYRNVLQEGNTLNTLLGDAKVVWRIKKVRLTAELRNIFNKQSYVETVYSGISTLTDSYILRPRELKVTAQWSL